ncbi:MAG: cytochrome c biogenesis protein ResB [Desulfobacterota bacterium]|nr:cytochrome c biogenesis protein ResB [Thermodesulfobacteriota bacterium]
MQAKDTGGSGMKGNRVLRGPASLRLTGALLFWIALLCIVATIIPQTPYRPTEGTALTGRIMMLLSLRDVFHSLWFLVPVALLALNMLACMALRMRVRGKSGYFPMPKTGLSEVALPADRDPRLVREGLHRLISASHAPAAAGSGERPVLMGEKGALRRFAPLIVHGSIFVVLVGAALAFTGFKGTMEIPVGETLDVVTLYDGTPMPLGFALRCDKFGIQYYDSGMPREYRSDVSFVSKGSTVLQRPVLVNHPVSHHGILFSQSGYNQKAEATLTVKGPSGRQSISAGEDAVIEMHDTGHRVHVMRVIQDMMSMGPGVQLLVEGPGGSHMLWLFRDIARIAERYPGITGKVPQFNPSLVKPYTFVLDGVTTRDTTILGVNRDPGVPFVAAGAILFLVGITMVFLMVHERVWAVVEEDQGRLTVKLAMQRNGKTVPVDVHVCEQVKGLGSVPS